MFFFALYTSACYLVDCTSQRGGKLHLSMLDQPAPARERERERWIISAGLIVTALNLGVNCTVWHQQFLF